MPMTSTHKQWRKERREKEGQCYVRIDTLPSTKAEWKAYADFKGLPMGTMIRQCIAQCMQQDGWTYQPPQEEEPQA